MILQSMTGFARKEGTSGRFRWAWELRSVNGKGLDVRLRIPPGYERIESDIRNVLSGGMSRGNVQASLSVQVEEARIEAIVNRSALAAILDLRRELADILDPAPIDINSLLALRNVIEFKEVGESAEEIAVLDHDILAGLRDTLADMVRMRHDEGQRLHDVLWAQIAHVEELVSAIEADPSRSPGEIRRRLAGQIETLMGAGGHLDRDRLHAEVALLATKADIREEIDRLKAHVAAARDLLAKGGPVGRKLDFLAQEFNRESNTVCSKANSAAVTAAGIELKVVIDQFREQVQNLE
jgi:uncharacterized protein (TIGR00255 family)